jgi:hypothetical protein
MGRSAMRGRRYRTVVGIKDCRRGEGLRGKGGRDSLTLIRLALLANPLRTGS